ncbi:Usp domain-containing protein [Psidium guajava]|nr:Usp domain-containing protein [Psidium guajava]
MAEVVAVNGVNKRKVMVAVDESECSHHALVWALDNLKDSLLNSSLVVFMAQPPSLQNLSFAANLGLARMYCPVSAAPDFVNSVQEQHRKLTLALLEKAKEICAARGVTAETITEVGDPKVAICDAVEKNNVTLLILGDHGLGKIKRAILGSVSNYCVQYAKCPVLVVKKAAE